ncbi:hypothetical protein ALC57_01203 [Trachymyrmex cornetzi]|uniref:Uncharacterized protein n=1 Tax=Trachymyrmex cornetzi TaxID=471704 RepID=A0A151JQK4_9HYME|nr:hypothetical protein ALC57_01203 [Trachymyrmex cornetzi]
MNQSTCIKCKRFISRTRPCAFCGADNSLIARIDSGLGLLDRLELFLETLNVRMMEFDGVLQRLGGVEGAANRLTVVTDGLSADLVAVGARQVTLEERIARLEGEVRADPATSVGGFHALPDGLSASFDRIINEQRNHELIVFGLPKVPSENCIETITRVSSSLGVLVSSSEIARAFRIPGRGLSSSPLIVKFTTIARRNELIVGACRRGGLSFSVVSGSSPTGRISICERATAVERRIFAEASRLAVSHGDGRVWMRRGITYFRIRDGAPSHSYNTPDSIHL